MQYVAMGQHPTLAKYLIYRRDRHRFSEIAFATKCITAVHHSADRRVFA